MLHGRQPAIPGGTQVAPHDHATLRVGVLRRSAPLQSSQVSLLNQGGTPKHVMAGSRGDVVVAVGLQADQARSKVILQVRGALDVGLIGRLGLRDIQIGKAIDRAVSELGPGSARIRSQNAVSVGAVLVRDRGRVVRIQGTRQRPFRGIPSSLLSQVPRRRRVVVEGLGARESLTELIADFARLDGAAQRRGAGVIVRVDMVHRR